MYKKWFLILVVHLSGIVVFSQVVPADTSLSKTDKSIIDTSLDYNDIMFDDLENFLIRSCRPAAIFFRHSPFKKDISITKAKQRFSWNLPAKLRSLPFSVTMIKAVWELPGWHHL
jgi:hypothetical protein